jgi:hypothetical protein
MGAIYRHALELRGHSILVATTVEKDISIRFTSADVSFGGDDKVRIQSHELVNALVHNKKAAIELLGNIASPVTSDQIEIDDLGRVVINDQVFKAKMAALRDTAGDNCGNNCSCKEA